MGIIDRRNLNALLKNLNRVHYLCGPQSKKAIHDNLTENNFRVLAYLLISLLLLLIRLLLLLGWLLY